MPPTTPTNKPASDRTPSEWDKKELGCAWKRQSNAGENYLSGTVNLKNIPGFPDQEVQFIGFSNKKKTKDTHPDIRIYISEKRSGGTAPAPRAASSAARPTAPAPRRAAAPVAAPAAEAGVDDNELI